MMRRLIERIIRGSMIQGAALMIRETEKPRPPRNPVTGQPMTVREQFESECG